VALKPESLVRLPAAVFVLSFAFGCASGVSERPAPSFSGPSGYGSAPVGIAAPSSHSQTLRTLVVKPDVLTTTFRLQAQAGDMRALTALRAQVDELTRRAKAVTSDATEVRVTGLGLSKTSTGKSAEEMRAAVVDGCIELPLPESLDYWARARLVLTLDDVTRAFAATLSAREVEPRLDIAFGSASATLKNPEAHRAALTRAWVERTQGFASATESAAAQLELVDCSPPDEIVVTPISLEEVALSLKLVCRLGVPETRRTAHAGTTEH
jgi:hypothetical protein